MAENAELRAALRVLRQVRAQKPDSGPEAFAAWRSDIAGALESLAPLLLFPEDRQRAAEEARAARAEAARIRLRSFRVKAAHGCLIVRDVDAADDLSDWDPAAGNAYRSGDSVIFGVMPGSEGPVDGEVFTEPPADPLPVVLVRETISSPAGRLVVHDPDETVRHEFGAGSGTVELTVLADDADFATKVQIVSSATP
ncbi:hypothetical protein M8542_31145 [Amycolatopsis sp. OK19-0408]|uniref:Uncharacterized protein n=1 Tax=Amycolatopsis iheyensis TaxID=2945988 RepID=A0A9X2NIH3_9PSEU|nr:hypothetical protein [Amycolatopsis iheyensis]MCR6487294.1 hypothetical protein [Amycolatopsis iheyensis]